MTEPNAARQAGAAQGGAEHASERTSGVRERTRAGDNAAMDDPGGRRIGVYVCHCGGNISDYVDVEKVIEDIRDADELIVVRARTRDGAVACPGCGTETSRVHGYHDDLRRISLKRLAALVGATGEKAETDRRRETMRVAAIEREYRAKLDDLRHNYALRVTVDWVQALELYVPVQRFEVLIKRRKGERLIRIDWHPLVRAVEPPLCEAGLGLDRVRFVCDDKLHLVAPTRDEAIVIERVLQSDRPAKSVVAQR